MQMESLSMPTKPESLLQALSTSPLGWMMGLSSQEFISVSIAATASFTVFLAAPCACGTQRSESASWRFLPPVSFKKALSASIFLTCSAVAACSLWGFTAITRSSKALRFADRASSVHEAMTSAEATRFLAS